MLYLLDANVLIDAARDYYPLDMVPEFWDWLLYQGAAGVVKTPVEIYEEVCDGRDGLAQWLREEETIDGLRLDEEVDPAQVSRVVSEGYAPDLTDDEVMSIGRDPFLVAHSLVDAPNRCIVTTEGSRPSRRRANRHLPDVCGTFAITCVHTFEFTKRLGFRTSWRPPQD